MTKYRKKPVVIEATQWFKMGDHPLVRKPTTTTLHTEWEKRQGLPAGSIGEIKTLEGYHLVTPGDFIITGVKGEHYPCKPDIFELTYELAQPEPVAKLFGSLPVYETTPQQRQWVGLTGEERNDIWKKEVGWGDPSHDDEDLMKAIEQALKDKNT
jgi:hypothetical protein